MIHNAYTVSALGHEPEECLSPTAEQAAEAYARETFTQLPYQLTCAVHEDGKLIGYFRVHFDAVVTVTPVQPPACHEPVVAKPTGFAGRTQQEKERVIQALTVLGENLGSLAESYRVAGFTAMAENVMGEHAATMDAISLLRKVAQ